MDREGESCKGVVMAEVIRPNIGLSWWEIFHSCYEPCLSDSEIGRI